jgi:GNAT superfamily N-acetyltransferase
VIFDVPRLLSNTRTWLSGRDPLPPGGDPALFRSGRPGAFHNGVSRLTTADLDTAIGEANEYLQGLPWLWWCGDDSRTDLTAELAARGARPAFEMPVMAAHMAGIPAVAGAAELEIEEVSTEEALAEWTRVYLAAMSPDPEDLEAVLKTEQRRSDTPGTYRRFLGRVDGRGVATSAVMLTNEVAGLYVVGVDPLFRKHGYGTAMSVTALAAARSTGATVATLQARSMAQPVYERLGFVTVSRYRLFSF